MHERCQDGANREEDLVLRDSQGSGRAAKPKSQRALSRYRRLGDFLRFGAVFSDGDVLVAECETKKCSGWCVFDPLRANLYSDEFALYSLDPRALRKTAARDFSSQCECKSNWN
jgi:hypothetical protein